MKSKWKYRGFESGSLDCSTHLLRHTWSGGSWFFYCLFLTKEAKTTKMEKKKEKRKTVFFSINCWGTEFEMTVSRTHSMIVVLKKTNSHFFLHTMKAILQPQLCCPFRTYFQLFITFHTDVFRTLSVSILSLQETIQTYVSRIRIFSAFYKLSSTKKKKRYIYSHALITEKQLKCQAFSRFTLKNCMYFVHEWRALIQKKKKQLFSEEPC